MAAALPATVTGAATVGRGAAVGQFAERGPRVQVVAQPAPTPVVTVATANEVLAAVNAARSNVGLGALVWNDRVATAAQRQADYLASIRRLSHDGPYGDAGDRLRAVGISRVGWGEALAYGFTDADALVETWMTSPGHRPILLGDYTYAGVGRAKAGSKYYWVFVAATT